jgi:RNA polymerase sigma-70 factor (ECF subfamily)
MNAEDAKISRFEREALPHLPRLYPAALRLADDPADADELVEETFARAYEDFGRRPAGTSPLAWLYRILVHLHDTAYRRHDTSGRPAVATAGSVTAAGSVTEEDLERLPDAAVVQALRELPAQDRIAVYLCDVEGFAYRDIARITQTSVGTVTARLRSGRRRLRRLLEIRSRRAGGGVAPGPA